MTMGNDCGWPSSRLTQRIVYLLVLVGLLGRPTCILPNLYRCPASRACLGLLCAIRYFGSQLGWDLLRRVRAGQAVVNIRIWAATAGCRGGGVGPYDKNCTSGAVCCGSVGVVDGGVCARASARGAAGSGAAGSSA